MVAFDGSERCGEAEAYFHDYLDDERRPPVPSAVIDHIRSCSRCRERLAQLKELLAETARLGAAEPAGRDTRIVDELQAHFEHLDEPVRCAQVKPFLPRLLDPSIRVRIPTPITIHLDNCPACSEDLEVLEGFELDAEHLAGLGAFFAQCLAEGTAGGPQDARGVRPGSSESLGVRVIDRLQALVGRRSSESAEPESISCEDISWSDIFDCILLMDLVADESGRMCRKETCRVHIAACMRCLDRVRVLSRTVSEIAERPDSQVATVCSLAGDVAPDPEEGEAAYEGYPLEVKVLNRPVPKSVPQTRDANVVPIRPIRRSPWIKVATLAAVIPLVIFLFFNNSTTHATGPTVAKFRKALALQQSVHVARFSVDPEGKERLSQETWASQAAGILISKTIGQRSARFEPQPDGSERIVQGAKQPDRYRVSQLKTRRGWEIEGEKTNEYELKGNMYDVAKTQIERLLGGELHQGLFNAKLQLIEKPEHEAQGIEVYELSWKTPGRRSARPQSYRLQITIDSEENRPAETRFWQGDRDGDLVLSDIRRFSYPEGGEIQDRFEALTSVN